MSLLQSLKTPKQSMEVINENKVYLNGDLYNKTMAAQVIAHWHVLSMIDDKTFSHWSEELNKV